MKIEQKLLIFRKLTHTRSKLKFSRLKKENGNMKQFFISTRVLGYIMALTLTNLYKMVTAKKKHPIFYLSSFQDSFMIFIT